MKSANIDPEIMKRLKIQTPNDEGRSRSASKDTENKSKSNKMKSKKGK
jgi:hypothetical protein